MLLYTKQHCPQCMLVKRFLDEHQCSYEEVKVDENPIALAQLKAQGIQQVPVLITGEEKIVGFNPQALQKLI